jgi:hypothetical protein
MRARFAHGAIAGAVTFGLLALIALPSLIGIDADRQQLAYGPRATDDIQTTGSLGPVAQPVPQPSLAPLSLSDEQRGAIHASIVGEKTPTTLLPDPDNTPSIPEFVPMQDMPAALTTSVPAVKDYKYVKLYDRILLVNPANRAVVAQIPRYRLLN